jgi:hypothetical protein
MLASAISSSALASISATHSSMQPICSVARPRWLCVATGTRSKDALDLLAEKPSLARRSRARAATSSCAHGHAVMPVADTPTSAAGAVLERDGAAVERVDLLRLDARDRRGLVLGVARGDAHLRALGALARAHQLGDVLGERLGPERRLAEHDLADRLVDDLLEARHVRALLLAAEIDEALQPREEQLVAMRTTFSTPVTPTRESPTATPGGRAWTSSPAPLRRRQRRGEPCRLHRREA